MAICDYLHYYTRCKVWWCSTFFDDEKLDVLEYTKMDAPRCDAMINLWGSEVVMYVVGALVGWGMW